MTIQENISLKPFNTFGLEVKARHFGEFTNISSLQSLLRSEQISKDHLMILGGGSNVLFTKNYDGLVLKNAILGKEIIEENDDNVWIKVGGGENWHQFVLYAIDHNWGGIENLSLIPGTVGAAPMQNIGAYGVEIKNVFEYLEAVEIADGSVKKFSKDECKFGYRESIFKTSHKDQYIITHVVFRLTKTAHQLNTSYGAIQDTLDAAGITIPTIKDISDAVVKIRQSKLPDPSQIGNAGSFFKNPTVDKIDFEGLRAEFPTIPGYDQPGDRVKVPAGWLIEQCGWKGYENNGIGVHKNQALVLVNYGQGDGEALEQLSVDVRNSVADKFGIELTTEVNII